MSNLLVMAYGQIGADLFCAMFGFMVGIIIGKIIVEHYE